MQLNQMMKTKVRFERWLHLFHTTENITIIYPSFRPAV